MITILDHPNLYKFSFTALSLKVKETIFLAQKLKNEDLSLEDLSPKDLSDPRGATSEPRGSSQDRCIQGNGAENP